MTYKIGDTVYYIKQIGVILESNIFEYFRRNDIERIACEGGENKYSTKDSGTVISSDTKAMCWGYAQVSQWDNNSYYKILIGNKKVIVHESEIDE